MSQLIFWEKYEKKKYFKMSSAEFLLDKLSVKSYILLKIIQYYAIQ